MPELTITLDRSVDVMRAIGEPTRARIVNVLSEGECSVSDLCDILGQSQPRISRHLRLLVEAEVCARHREGNYVFFSLHRSEPTSHGADSLVHLLVSALDRDDPVLAADLARLTTVRERRAELAHQHFAEVAERWDRERTLHTPDELVEPAIVHLLSPNGHGIGDVLDIGTGTGRMIELLAPMANRIVGLDSNPSMLRVARANLDRARIHHAELRQSDIFATSMPGSAFDVAVVHQVLHFLDDPARAIHAAADLVVDGGRVLVVDLPRHSNEALRVEHAHRRLGFTSEQMNGWFADAGLLQIDHQMVEPKGRQTGLIAVGLWIARKGAT